MLTPTDIHYIVGLLIGGYESEHNIELELGSSILDEVADQNRDIDITIKYRDDRGNINALRGLEVKSHKRPLTTEQVEQLCAKFRDISAITHKGIISASGYTKSAVKKAQYYNVDLFHLEPWIAPNSHDFFEVAFAKEMKWNETIYYWHKTLPSHELVFTSQNPSQLGNTINENSLLFVSLGKPYKFHTLSMLYAALDQRVLKEFINDRKVSSKMHSGEVKDASVSVNIEDKIYLLVQDRKCFIDRVRIKGSIIRVDSQLRPEFKTIRKHTEKRPHIGCAISESQFGLIGISINQKTDMSSQGIFHIPINERLKRKIYRQKIRLERN